MMTHTNHLVLVLLLIFSFDASTLFSQDILLLNSGEKLEVTDYKYSKGHILAKHKARGKLMFGLQEVTGCFKPKEEVFYYFFPEIKGSEPRKLSEMWGNVNDMNLRLERLVEGDIRLYREVVVTMGPAGAPIHGVPGASSGASTRSDDYYFIENGDLFSPFTKKLFSNKTDAEILEPFLKDDTELWGRVKNVKSISAEDVIGILNEYNSRRFHISSAPPAGRSTTYFYIKQKRPDSLRVKMTINDGEAIELPLNQAYQVSLPVDQLSKICVRRATSNFCKLMAGNQFVITYNEVDVDPDENKIEIERVKSKTAIRYLQAFSRDNYVKKK